MMKQTFQVDFQILQRGSIMGRMQLQGSPMFNLRGSTSDFAIQQYIQSKYPGKDINILSISWK